MRFFEISSAKLTPVARDELDKMATMLKNSRRDGNVRIVGHTCDLGSDKFNLQLSMKRATAVRDYLVAAGAITADAAILEGKGSAEPKFAPKAGTRSKNRRVELGVCEPVGERRDCSDSGQEHAGCSRHSASARDLPA
jgi:outer membrane protein OmpA-like peptidoglycan-associated protein